MVLHYWVLESEWLVLVELIAHRYESGNVVIKSNQPFSHRGQIFPDAQMTVAIIDGIMHHNTNLEIDGDSYRRNLKKIVIS